MSMTSTVAPNCMTGHHIIYTISGRDHRPARPRYAGTVRMTSHPNGKERS